MVWALNMMLVVALLLNLFALGTSRLRTLVQAVAFQGVVIGITPLLAHPHPGAVTWLIACATITLKGTIIPRILFIALREAQVKREIEPTIGFMASMLLGSLGTAVAIGLASRLPMAPGHAQTLIVPASLSTVLTGFLLMTSRFKAITQVVGYLVLENGILIFGLLLVEAMPVLVELGVLLDLFVAVFVIAIIMHHINRAFDSLDTRRLSALKE
jgi:hydrogenase-4 component E